MVDVVCWVNKEVLAKFVVDGVIFDVNPVSNDDDENPKLSFLKG